MEKSLQQDYKDILEIIMSLPKSEIRNFPYITKIINTQHTAAYEKICTKFEECESKNKQKIRELEKNLEEIAGKIIPCIPKEMLFKIIQIKNADKKVE